MQNKTNHPTADTDRLVDALMGFDHREFLHQMTDGLAPWHRRRRENLRETTLYLKSLALVAVMVLPAYHLAGTANYRLSGGATYNDAVAQTQTLLGQ